MKSFPMKIGIWKPDTQVCWSYWSTPPNTEPPGQEGTVGHSLPLSNPENT